MPLDRKVVGYNPILAVTPGTLGKSFTNSLYYILYTAGMHSPRAGSDPRACFIRPSEQVKNTRNFFCTTEILLMNLNFIQLSTNLQLITIRNGSSGKNIKPPWAPPGFFLRGANPETIVYVQRLRGISVYSVYLWNTNTCCPISLCRNRLCQTLCMNSIL